MTTTPDPSRLRDAEAALRDLARTHGVPVHAAPGHDDPALTRVGADSARVWGFDWPRPPEPRPSAVLILFGALDDVPADCASPRVHPDVDVLLTQRAPTLRQHAGQIAFPGGRMDPEDADVVAAALREAREETGLDPAGVDVLGVLPPVPVIVSGHLVHPVLGWWRESSRVGVVDHAEAAAVFRMPVADLVDPTHRVRVRVPHGRGRTRPRPAESGRDGSERGRETPGFLVGDRLVWGFTAALLERVLDLLGWTEPGGADAPFGAGDAFGADDPGRTPPVVDADTREVLKG